MTNRCISNLPLTLLCLLLVTPFVTADEKLAGIACRSVHLGYPAEDGQAFYNEMTVRRSADGSYFMACGFRQGYFGVQELANGKKVALFSVWDPGRQDDPRSVAEERRVQMIAKDEKVRVGRFGGEGTGGQAFFDYEWRLDETQRFLVKARLNGDRTEFSGYLYLPKAKEWKHLVTFSTLAGGKRLGGYYSFVEDFRRNRVSATKARAAEYGNGWVQTLDGQWHALTKARFTADANPATNVDAGVVGGRFFLATGGDTPNGAAKLRAFLDLPSSGAPAMPPADLP